MTSHSQAFASALKLDHVSRPKAQQTLMATSIPPQIRGDRLHACAVNWRSQFRVILTLQQAQSFC
jgi:hypothetical protein